MCLKETRNKVHIGQFCGVHFLFLMVYKPLLFSFRIYHQEGFELNGTHKLLVHVTMLVYWALT
jgi:hypothetical protein